MKKFSEKFFCTSREAQNNKDVSSKSKLFKNAMPLTSGLMLCLPFAAQAQAVIEEVFVTATKRAESVQDVPVSVSAITGDRLTRARITTADDLAMQIPNLHVTATVGEGTPIFSLRGVSMSDFSLNQSGPVATYYDEVYKGNFALLGVALYDLERVEVLRGPQGTLYGKNTTGGAVNLISRQPELDMTEGYLNLGYGNYNRREASGALSLPLGSSAAGRVAFTATRADGWFDNELPGKPDLAGVREHAVRGSLRWEPGDSVSFVLRASTSLQNPHNYGVYGISGSEGIGNGVYEAFGSGTSYFRPEGLGRREGELNYTPRRRARTHAVALTANIDVSDGLTVTSITSWDKGTLNFGEDTDGTPNETLEIFYGDRAEQLAQDLRLTSSWGGPFNFILGAYFSREEVFNTTTFGFFRDIDVTGDGTVDVQDCLAGLPLGCNLVNSFDQLKRSTALYTDMNYDLSERLTLRGGLRYTRDTGSQTDLEAGAFGVDGVLGVPLILPTDNKFKDDNLSGKIGVDFNATDNVMFYASYNHGYRGRAFNAQAFFDASEVAIAEPETLDAFEIGTKTQFANRRVTLNGAVFYYQYKNQQFLNVDTDTAAQTLINVDRSRIYGGELELSAYVNDMLSVRAGAGLLSSSVQQGMLSGVELDGNQLLNAPEVTFNAGLDITAFDSGAGRLSLHPDISYVSSHYFDIFNTSYLKQSGYVLFGAHVDYERGPFTASAWAKNLSDKFYTTAQVDGLGAFGFVYNHVGTPRTFGVTVGYEF